MEGNAGNSESRSTGRNNWVKAGIEGLLVLSPNPSFDQPLSLIADTLPDV